MAESTPPNPNHMVPPSTSGELPPPPSFRITNEYDSEGSIYMNRVSCKIFDGLGKLRLSFQNNRRGEVVAPQIGFISKNLTVLYDVEEQNAVVRSSVDLGSKVHLQADHYVKEAPTTRSKLVMKLGWASIWLGDESFKAKCAPMKMKVQFMIQVPQDNIRSPLFMFRVKKSYEDMLSPLGFQAEYIDDNDLAIGARKGREKLGRWKRSKSRALL